MATRPALSVYQRSCAPCAAAKRTCDHQQPCGRCVTLQQPDKCVILPDSRRRVRAERASFTRDHAGAETREQAQAVPCVSETVTTVEHEPASPGTALTVATSATRHPAARTRPTDPANTHRPEHQQNGMQDDLLVPLPSQSERPASLRKRVRRIELPVPDGVHDAVPRTDFSILDVDIDLDEVSERTITYRHEEAGQLEVPTWTLDTRILMRHEDAMVRIMHFQYSQDKILTLCVPSIPLATPIDALRPMADARGRVPIEHVLGMLHDASSLRHKRDAYEAGVLSFLARLPEPNMRYIYWQPEELNLAGTDMMAPRLLYGNFAWVFMLFLRRMIPAYMIPMDGSRVVSRALLADALRLFIALGAPLPAVVLTRGIPVPTPQLLLALDDDALLAMYEDGVFMPRNREGSYSPKNIITPGERDGYFRTVAQRIANRERVCQMHVRLEMRGELLISIRPDIRAPFDVEFIMHELPRVRELVQHRPLVLELLRTLSQSTWYVVDVDETLALEFSPLGLLQSVNGTYQNVRFHTVIPCITLPESRWSPPEQPSSNAADGSELQLISAELDATTTPVECSEGSALRSESPFSMVGHTDGLSEVPVIDIGRALIDVYHAAAATASRVQ